MTGDDCSVAGQRRWVTRTAVLLTAGALGLALALAARLLDTADPGAGIWGWTERLSWLAGMVSVLAALIPVLTRNSDSQARRVTVRIRSNAEDRQHGAPGTSSIDVPLGQPDVLVRGRDALLKRLEKGLSHGDPEPRVHVLHGLGGCGKTTIALMLARRAVRHGTSVWWVSAATETELHTDMRHLASRMGATDDEIDRAWAGLDSATDLLWRLLDPRTDRWLLVIDNADEPEALAGSNQPLNAATGWLRPPRSRKGRVVVASRDGNPDIWGAWCQLHPIPGLSATEGTQVLLDHAGTRAGTAQDAEALTTYLGGLPLALRLAGSYIAETAAMPWPSPGDTFRDYQSALEAGRLDELTNVAIGAASTADRSRQVITRTWELSLDLLDRRGMPQARTLLELLCQLAEAPIPYQLVLHPETIRASELFAGMDAIQLWRLLRALAHLGLIDLPPTPSDDAASVSEEPAVLRIHPLVRQVIRARTGTVQKASYLALAAAILHRVTDSEGLDSSEDPRRWHIWEALAPHIVFILAAAGQLPQPDRRVIEHAAYATHATGLYLRSQGLFHRAERVHRAVLSTFVPILGNDHISILAARDAVASLTHASGDLDTAEVLYRETLAGRRRLLGDNHPQTLATRHQLAYLLLDRGLAEAAEAECRVVISAIECTQGRDHRLSAISQFLLSRALQSQGRLDEAEANQREALSATRRIFGNDHPRTLGNRTDLARLRHERGNLDEAESEYQATLAIQRMVLSDEHRDTLLTRSQLAQIAYDRGVLKIAEAEFRDVLAIQQRVLGEDHPHALTTRHRLARVLRDRGDVQAAEAAYQSVLDARSQKFGHDHPDTVTVREELASLREGRSRDAC